MNARKAAAALLLEVRPLPMAAALLTVALGFAWARGDLRSLPRSAPFLWGSVFFGLYSAHLMDTYVDVVGRGDRTPTSYPLLFRDSTGLLADRAYPPLIATSASLCALFAVPPSQEGGAAVAVLLGLGLTLALTYAPLLDRTLLGVSAGYPAGVFAVLGAAYLTAGGGLDLRFTALAAALFLALAGAKVRADVIDLDDDRRVGKCTVAVTFGAGRAVAAGYGVGAAGLALCAALPVLFPVSPLFIAPAAGVAAAWAATGKLAPMRASMAMVGALFALLVCDVAIAGFASRAWLG